MFKYFNFGAFKCFKVYNKYISDNGLTTLESICKLSHCNDPRFTAGWSTKNWIKSLVVNFEHRASDKCVNWISNGSFNNTGDVIDVWFKSNLFKLTKCGNTFSKTSGAKFEQSWKDNFVIDKSSRVICNSLNARANNSELAPQKSNAFILGSLLNK